MCMFIAKSMGNKSYPVKKIKIPIKACGYDLFALLLIPDIGQKLYPTIIGVHGYNGSYRDFSRAAGLCQAKSGYAVICFDFYGGSKNSKSGGKMKDMSLSSEIKQLSAVINSVKNMDFVDTKNIFLMGQSQGGLISALTAPKFNDDLNSMILYYPAFNIPDLLMDKYGRTDNLPDKPELFGMQVSDIYYKGLEGLDLYREAAGFKKPVMVLHGDMDKVVDINYGKRAFAIYENSEFHIIPGSGHGLTNKGKLLAAGYSYDFILKHILT